MGLLDQLGQRGGVPSQAHAQRMQRPGLPLRGPMPWRSGFEGFQNEVLEEIMRRMMMQQTQAQAMAGKIASIPGFLQNKMGGG